MKEPVVLSHETRLEDGVRAFLEHIAPRFASRTLIVYRRALRLMCDVVGKECPLSQIGLILRQFREFVQANYPANTARTYAAAAGQFAAWAGKHLGSQIRQPSLPDYRSPRFLSDQEMERLRKAIPDLPSRDRLIVHLLLLGLRPGEIVSLESSSLLDVGSRPALRITYRRGSREHQRVIYIPDDVAALFRKQAEASPDGRAVSLTVRSVEARVRTIGEKCGISNLSPMDIRWTRIREMLQERRAKGMPVDGLRWYFGVSPMQWRSILEICDGR